MRTFSSSELAELEKFIRSPLFNKGRNLQHYYNEVLKILNDYDSTRHNQLYFYEKIFPGKVFNSRARAYINKLNSELLKLTDEYFIYSYYSSNPVKSRMALHESLREKSLNKYSLKKIKQSKKIASEQFDPEDFFHKLLVMNSIESGAYLMLNRLKEYRILFEKRPLLFMADFIIQFWQAIIHEAGLLYQFNFKIKSIDILKKIITPDIEKKIIEELKSAEIPGYDEAVIIYNISLAYRELGNEKLFIQAKNSVFKKLDNFDHKSKFNILLYLEGLIIFSENIKGVIWNDHRDEIIKTMLKKKIVSHSENQIYFITFENITKFLISRGKYTEAENFVKEYSPLLPSNIRKSCESLTMAWIHFAKKEFGKALEYNSRVSDDLFNQSKDSKLIEILCHYEMKDFDQALNSSGKLSKYISENKTMNPETVQGYLNFSSAVRMLINLYYNRSDKGYSEKLQYLIDSGEVLYRKEWIKAKLEELRAFS
ncbi:MAG: hypothetical protein N2510_03120 [Ignavibacteria bacterium]|nr:hypothetical protein [Ignavibacteria bacterium]